MLHWTLRVEIQVSFRLDLPIGFAELCATLGLWNISLWFFVSTMESLISQSAHMVDTAATIYLHLVLCYCIIKEKIMKYPEK